MVAYCRFGVLVKVFAFGWVVRDAGISSLLGICDRGPFPRSMWPCMGMCSHHSDA